MLSFASCKLMSPAVSESPTGDIEVQIIESNHTKKANQEDHSGGSTHGGHDDHEEEVGLGETQTYCTEKCALFLLCSPSRMHAYKCP